MQHSYTCSHFVKELGLWEQFLKRKQEWNEEKAQKPKVPNKESCRKWRAKNKGYHKKYYVSRTK